MKNAERILDNLAPSVENVKSSNSKLEKDIEDLAKQIDRVNNQSTSTDDVKNYEFLLKKLDPHKLCQIDGELKEIEAEQKR